MPMLPFGAPPANINKLLPAQAGNSGKYLTTNGSSISWATVSGSGGISRSVSTVSTNTNAGSSATTDYVYFVSGVTAITLPTAIGNTNLYTIKNIDTSGNTTTINTTSLQTIDGFVAIYLTEANASVDLLSNNSNWRIV